MDRNVSMARRVRADVIHSISFAAARNAAPGGDCTPLLAKQFATYSLTPKHIRCSGLHRHIQVFAVSLLNKMSEEHTCVYETLLA